MISLHAAALEEGLGPHGRTVLAYTRMVEERARGGNSPPDWKPLEALVAVDDFQRVGAYGERMNWREYVDFLGRWAGSTRFEAALHRLVEVGELVFQELTERHWHGEAFMEKEVLVVYAFDDRGRIRHIAVYEQRADDGLWIAEAARAATGRGAP